MRTLILLLLAGGIVFATWVYRPELLPWVAGGLLFLALVRRLFRKGFSAKVLHVADGATITVRRRGKETRVRLYGVDAPEVGDPYANQATELVRRLAERP